MDSASADADAWHDDDALIPHVSRTWQAVFSVAGLLLVASGLLEADGGVVQFRGQSGPFVVTLFSSPSPLRSGPADLSVLLESADNHVVILDAEVVIELRQRSGREIAVKASHAAATNKLLYVAFPDIPNAGTWAVSIRARLNGAEGTVGGEIEVLPAPSTALAYWPYFAAIPCCIGLFILNQRLKARAAMARTRSEPS